MSLVRTVPSPTHDRCARRPRAWVTFLVTVAASLLFVATAQPAPSGHYGAIAIGESVERVVPSADEAGYGVHGYTVTVPPNTTSLTIAVDGGDADLDLAVRLGAPITTYDDVDFLDLGPGGSPTYTLASPPAGVVHLEVLNLGRNSARYTVTVEAAGVPDPDVPDPDVPDPDVPDPDDGVSAASFPSPVGPGGEGMPNGEYGPIEVQSATDGVLAPAGETNSYHTFWIDVPNGVRGVSIAVDGLGSDLDLALRAGEPIESYDNVDYLDTSTNPNPQVTIDILLPIRVYVDVISFARQPTPYRLIIDVTAGAPTETEAPGASDAPSTPATPATPSDADAAPGNPLTSPGSNPLLGDPWVGRYEGDGLTVTIEGAGGTYRGALGLSGQSFPLEATVSGGQLQGTFTSGGQSFAFTATLDGDVLTIDSDGARFRTVRRSD